MENNVQDHVQPSVWYSRRVLTDALPHPLRPLCCNVLHASRIVKINENPTTVMWKRINVWGEWKRQTDETRRDDNGKHFRSVLPPKRRPVTWTVYVLITPVVPPRPSRPSRPPAPIQSHGFRTPGLEPTASRRVWIIVLHTTSPPASQYHGHHARARAIFVSDSPPPAACRAIVFSIPSSPSRNNFPFHRFCKIARPITRAHTHSHDTHTHLPVAHHTDFGARAYKNHADIYAVRRISPGCHFEVSRAASIHVSTSAKYVRAVRCTLLIAVVRGFSFFSSRLVLFGFPARFSYTVARRYRLCCPELRFPLKNKNPFLLVSLASPQSRHVHPQSPASRPQRVGQCAKNGCRGICRGPRAPRDARSPKGRAHCREPAVLRHGRVFLSPGVPGGRRQAGWRHQSQDVRRGQAEKSQGYTLRHATVRSYIGDFVPGAQGQWRLRDDHGIPCTTQHPQDSVQRRWAVKNYDFVNA